MVSHVMQGISLVEARDVQRTVLQSGQEGIHIGRRGIMVSHHGQSCLVIAFWGP